MPYSGVVAVDSNIVSSSCL